MKTKRNLLVASLLVMVLLTAVGYASMSDTLDADGTATNGTFNVEFVDMYIDTPNIQTTVKKQDSSQNENDYLNIKLLNALPKEYSIPFRIENKGTTAAKIGQSGVILTDTDGKYFDVRISPFEAFTLEPGTSKDFYVYISPKATSPIWSSGEGYTIQHEDYFKIGLRFDQVV